jgi:hypothetical protein
MDHRMGAGQLGRDRSVRCFHSQAGSQAAATTGSSSKRVVYLGERISNVVDESRHPNDTGRHLRCPEEDGLETRAFQTALAPTSRLQWLAVQ